MLATIYMYLLSVPISSICIVCINAVIGQVDYFQLVLVQQINEHICFVTHLI